MYYISIRRRSSHGHKQHVNKVKFVCVVPEICMQTDRHAYHNTLHLYWGRIIINNQQHHLVLMAASRWTSISRFPRRFLPQLIPDKKLKTFGISGIGLFMGWNRILSLKHQSQSNKGDSSQWLQNWQQLSCLIILFIQHRTPIVELPSY